MKTGYHHLTQEERYHIGLMRKQNKSLGEIARGMNRNKSAISRELRRNLGQRGYRYQQVHRKTLQRQQDKPKAIKWDDAMQWRITPLIEAHWSPEQIAGRLKLEGQAGVSHETIYRFLLADKQQGGTLYRHLRHQAKPYRKRYDKPDGRGKIPGRVDIYPKGHKSERPQAANDKQRLGDWEADTVIGQGHQGVLVTLTERVSKLNVAFALPTKKRAVPGTPSSPCSSRSRNGSIR